MPANVEIKARVQNPENLLTRARALADGPETLICQKDTFFNADKGRLKLREFGDGTGELIRYSRPDASGPKVSDYTIYRTNDPDGLADALVGSLGLLGVVEKNRTLLLSGRTRIHVDEVKNLGWFMELEVVLKEGEDPARGDDEARELMTRLGIEAGDLVQGAYLDLLLAGPGGRSR
jgi:predicted adenylyl cyclase CyaB